MRSITNSKITLFQHLNEKIRFQNFLLVNEKGENIGIVAKEEALQIARNSKLDLLCIAPNATPPVCKVLDFSKYVYQIKKKNTNKSGKGNKGDVIKEAKFSFAIGENDATVKIKKILKWLEDGLVVKVVLFMRGREQQHKDLALQKVNRILVDITSSSPIFQLKDEIKLTGNSYIMTLFKNSKKNQRNEKN